MKAKNNATVEQKICKEIMKRSVLVFMVFGIILGIHVPTTSMDRALTVFNNNDTTNTSCSLPMEITRSRSSSAESIHSLMNYSDNEKEEEAEFDPSNLTQTDIELQKYQYKKLKEKKDLGTVLKELKEGKIKGLKNNLKTTHKQLATYTFISLYFLFIVGTSIYFLTQTDDLPHQMYYYTFGGQSLYNTWLGYLSGKEAWKNRKGIIKEIEENEDDNNA